MKNLEKFESFGNNEKTNEKFDWMDWDNSDLAATGWDARCQELVDEFKAVLDKEMPAEHAARTEERKQALQELLVIFGYKIEDAKEEAAGKFPIEK